MSDGQIDIYNTSNVLASTTPSPFYSSSVGFLASGAIELSYNGDYFGFYWHSRKISTRSGRY